MPMPKPGNTAPAAGAGFILLVEDEAGIRELLVEILRGHGFGVIEAANADEAWSYLQNGGPADALFSDVAMPGSMNGLELVRRVRQTYPRIVTLLTSGHGAPHRVQELDVFIPKPFQLHMVARLLLDRLRPPPPHNSGCDDGGEIPI